MSLCLMNGIFSSLICGVLIVLHFKLTGYKGFIQTILLFTHFILQDMLPEYIPMRVAESILFAGKAVRILRNPSPSFLSGDDVYPQMPKSFQKIHGFAGRFHLQREPVINTGMGGEDLLPQSEADKIEAMLQDLKVFVSLHCTVSYRC